MNTFIIVLRLIHILAGVFWVGSSVTLGYFITPTIAATGEAGLKFLDHIVNKVRIPVNITVSALLTVLAGATLYWIDSAGGTSAWTYSGPGWGFGLGGLLAFIGLVFGIMTGRGVVALAKVAAQVNGKPTPEQMGRMQAVQKQLRVVVPIHTLALVLALACMATARYWRF